MIEVLWSDLILDEVQRTLPKLCISPERAARRVTAMREGFGAAALVDDFAQLISDMTRDETDRHVLAAAVRGEADCIVTPNPKDFSLESTEPYGVEVLHPDLFLLRLLNEHPSEVAARHRPRGRRRPTPRRRS